MTNISRTRLLGTAVAAALQSVAATPSCAVGGVEEGRTGMQLEEIKAAVDRGEKVHWANTGYTVIKDRIGQYLIAYQPGTRQESYIGLTWRDGVTLNGRPEQFFIAPQAPVSA